MESFEEIKKQTESSFHQGLLTAAAIVRMQSRMARDDYSIGYNAALEHAAKQLETIVKMSEDSDASKTLHPGVSPSQPKPASSNNSLRCTYCDRDSCSASYRGGYCEAVPENAIRSLSDWANEMELESHQCRSEMVVDSDAGEKANAEPESPTSKKLPQNEKGSG